jgi:Flp pilus assembly protein TadB
VDPGLMVPFLRSFAGIIVVVAVAGLITGGWLLIRKIINIDI